MTAELKEQLEGKWKNYKNENYEPYLDACALEPLEMKIAKNVKPILKFTVEGDVITSKIRSESGLMKNKIKFRLGEEYEYTYLGKGLKGVAIWSDGKLSVHVVPKGPKKKEQFFENQVINGELVQTLTAGGVTAKRYYKKASKVSAS